MKQKITAAVGDLFSEVVAWVLRGGDGWMQLGVVVLLVAGFFLFLALFLQATPAKRRDIIDLFHGRRKRIR